MYECRNIHVVDKTIHVCHFDQVAITNTRLENTSWYAISAVGYAPPLDGNSSTPMAELGQGVALGATEYLYIFTKNGSEWYIVMT